MAKGRKLEERLANHPLWGILSKKRNGSYEYDGEDCVIILNKEKEGVQIKIQTPEHYFHESYVDGENKQMKRGKKPLKKGYVVTQNITYDFGSARFSHEIDFQNFSLPLDSRLKVDLNEKTYIQFQNGPALSEKYGSFIHQVLDGIFEKIHS